MAPAVVLLTEDEPDLRQLLAFASQQENFIVLPARNAAEALEMFHRHGNVDVVLTYVQLGAGMNGAELADRILEEEPTTKALLISGVPDSEILAAERGLPFLGKPFLPNALIERVQEVLELKIPAQSETKAEAEDDGMNVSAATAPECGSDQGLEEITIEPEAFTNESDRFWCSYEMDAVRRNRRAAGDQVQNGSVPPELYHGRMRVHNSVALLRFANPKRISSGVSG